MKGVEGGDRTQGMGGEMRRAKSLRIGVHHANAVVWGPVYRTRRRRRGGSSRRRAPPRSSSRGCSPRSSPPAMRLGGSARTRASGARRDARGSRRRTVPSSRGLSPRASGRRRGACARAGRRARGSARTRARASSGSRRRRRCRRGSGSAACTPRSVVVAREGGREGGRRGGRVSARVARRSSLSFARFAFFQKRGLASPPRARGTRRDAPRRRPPRLSSDPRARSARPRPRSATS